MAPRSINDPRLLARLTSGDLSGDWTLNKATSRATLRTRSMWGMAGVQGTFTALSGAAMADRDGKVIGTLAIGSASLDTHNSRRDRHLRSADFLDAEKYPSIVYQATRVSAGQDGLTAYGTLTVRGTTRPVIVPLSVSAPGDDQIQLSATITINRAEFGLDWNPMGLASMNSQITVHATFGRG